VSIPGVVSAPAVVIVVAVVVAHRVDGKTVPKNRSQSQQSDSYPASHVHPPSTAGPAGLDHFAENLALPIVEDAVNLAERPGGDAAQLLSGAVDTLLGVLQRRFVELRTAQRSRHIGAGVTNGATELARRVLELVERRQDGLLLTWRRVETGQDREEEPATSTAKVGARVAPAPGRVAVAPMAAVVMKSPVGAPAYQNAHEADETDGADDEAEKHEILLQLGAALLASPRSSVRTAG